jgi:PhzF family phenazine biosynthesis protein
MGIPITIVDAFTDKPFAGNPAAVCILPEPREDDWMQRVAREMNLSETAFLHPEAEGFRLRWFTPAVEVDLCGHATLASAHILWERAYLQPEQQAIFQTRSGRLTADRKGDWIELDFPAHPPTEATPPPGLVNALGIKPRYVGRNRLDYLVEVESEELVRKLQPDFRALKNVEARGIIVTSQAVSAAYDFVSRFFAPAAGIDEDPVTGSAHCCLGPFWKDRLRKSALVAYQASARGGVLRVGVAGERVLLGGKAVTVFQGQLTDEH